MTTIFTIKGLDGNQATIVRKMQRRAYLEGYVDCGSAVGAGFAGYLSANLLQRFFQGFVTAAEVGGVGTAAFAVAEGTLAATMLTVAVPIIGGTLIGIGAGYGIRYIGRKVINSSEELDLTEAIEKGEIEIVDSADVLKMVEKERTGFKLFFEPDWGDMKVKKPTSVTQDKSEPAATADANADKPAGEAATTDAAPSAAAAAA